MSEVTSSDVETVERAFAAYNRGDLDAILAEIDPEVEWHLSFELPDLPPGKTVFHGHDEVRALWDSFREVWDQLQLDLEEVLYDHDGLLIERVRFWVRGGGSGVDVDRILFYVMELRDGKLLRQRPFESEEEAFDAAGVQRG